MKIEEQELLPQDRKFTLEVTGQELNWIYNALITERNQAEAGGKFYRAERLGWLEGEIFGVLNGTR